jgi:protocatechuate 3,4-dioxygenase alpha subunit
MCLGTRAHGQPHAPNILTRPSAQGERIRIEGRVFDGDRKPIEDALLELWQADASGHYCHPLDRQPELRARDGESEHDFSGFGRANTDWQAADGAYWFETIRPGAVPDATGVAQAPHLNLIVHARGMLLPSFTRLYFSDCPAQNERDSVLRSVPMARRSTLIAQRVAGTAVFEFDIRFQGADETVFFDF